MRIERWENASEKSNTDEYDPEEHDSSLQPNKLLPFIGNYRQPIPRGIAFHLVDYLELVYHLVVETVDGNLSKGMRQLNCVYTQANNRRHHRVGHVYQGRFKGILVDTDSYLLELSRYVVLNPMRARMVNQLRHWKWSSYPAMTGKVKSPDSL